MNEEDIYRLLAPLAGGQVFQYVAPAEYNGQAIRPPWVVFSIVSDVSADVLCGQAESSVSVQIDAWALTMKEARTLRDMALEAVRPLKPSRVTRIPSYEPETRLHRATLEFQVTV